MTALADPIPRSPQPYRTPDLLQDIRLLDLLELSGTTVLAGTLLNLSQPTVSRRYRLLAQDFGLERQPRQREGCRYGSSEAMRHIRLGCRAHRLAAGVARIGADLIHQPLLAGIAGLLPVPVRFRSIETWATLVREGVLDGAVLPEAELQAARQRDLSGLQLLDAGTLQLGLALSPAADRAPGDWWPTVLVPHRSIAPGLHQTLKAQGLELKSFCSDPGEAHRWLQRISDAPLAFPAYTWTAPQASWSRRLNVVGLPRETAIRIQLLLPQLERMPDGLIEAWEQLRRALALAADEPRADAWRQATQPSGAFDA